MPIVFGNINPVSASSTGIQTVDNGLTANTATNAELGGNLTIDTLINLVTFFFQINGGGVNFKLTPGANPRAVLTSSVGSSSASFSQGQTFWQILLNHGANANSISQFQNNPITVSEAETQTGFVYNFNYNTNQLANDRAVTDVGGVKALIVSSGGTIYAKIAGQVFTGNISAPNLSGTNTGDQNLTPYALLASPTFTGTPAAPTPATADNTTKLATTAYVQANLASYPKLVVTGKLLAQTASVNVFTFAVDAVLDLVYRISAFLELTAFTSGSSVLFFTYTDVAGTLVNQTLTTGNAVGTGNVSPRAINCKHGTNIVLGITVTGTNTSNFGGCVELLF